MYRFTQSTVVSPSGFYSAPLKDYLLFVCKHEPKLADYEQFNDFTEAQLKAYKPAST